MSKKRKIRSGPRPKKKVVIFNKEQISFSEEIARRVCANMVFPFENEMKRIWSELENTKANLISLMTLLEEKELVDAPRFFELYNNYISTETGVIDGGKMMGRSIISLYN